MIKKPRIHTVRLTEEEIYLLLELVAKARLKLPAKYSNLCEKLTQYYMRSDV